jgi:very-short-patch-repair endonuclease
MRLVEIRSRARAHGIVVFSDLVPEHMSKEAWRHAHDTGLLVHLHHCVSRLIDAPPTPEQAILAGVLAAAPTSGAERTMAAGRTAAYLVGVGVPPDDPIHVTTRGRPRPAPLSGVRIHRPLNHLDLVANHERGIPVARMCRILLDVAAWDPHLTSAVLEEMIVKRLITIHDAQATVRRHSKQGRPGLKVLRATVDAWASKQRPPDSVLEERFAKLRRDFDLPEFEFQRRVGRFIPDFCRILEMVIVECDGYKDHGRREAQVASDKARDAELTSQGWVVMRFTWEQINKRSAWVASRIAATLRIRTAQLAKSA